ncbi:MAG: permease prefix domain 1-containing protein [Oscillospiraceae bacterium]|nr:permease prefix domain 1-containing protein [Oscillospiraceae bacterium]MCL2279048.1 permease prefix domain 1-containing protein [Oscillospiraceae bacterium]
MQDKLRKYIDGLFENTTPTRKSVELKEEMIQNLHDKYNDLLGEGKSEEAAYNIAVAGIGDISGLLKELEADRDTERNTDNMNQEARQKSAMLTSIAVALYILSPIPLIMLELAGARDAALIGLPLFFLFIAAATGLLIYNNMTKPRYGKDSETMVEEFREWQSDEKDRKALRKAISSAMWTIIVAVYLIVSFMTMMWWITWIIFIIGMAIEALMNVFYVWKKN